MPRNRGGTCDPSGAHVVTENRLRHFYEREFGAESFWRDGPTKLNPDAAGLATQCEGRNSLRHSSPNGMPADRAASTNAS